MNSKQQIAQGMVRGIATCHKGFQSIPKGDLFASILFSAANKERDPIGILQLYRTVPGNREFIRLFSPLLNDLINDDTTVKELKELVTIFQEETDRVAGSKLEEIVHLDFTGKDLVKSKTLDQWKEYAKSRNNPEMLASIEAYEARPDDPLGLKTEKKGRI